MIPLRTNQYSIQKCCQHLLHKRYCFSFRQGSIKGVSIIFKSQQIFKLLCKTFRQSSNIPTANRMDLTGNQLLLFSYMRYVVTYIQLRYIVNKQYSYIRFKETVHPGCRPIYIREWRVKIVWLY